MWIIIGIAALLIIVWLFTGSQTINNTSTPSYIGMYNMNLHIEYKKKYSQTRDPYYLYASIFNEVLGYAAQGRTSDINHVYKNDLDPLWYHEDFISFMQDLKPDIMAMSRIGKRVDNADMSSSNIDFTSIGDLEDKLLRKSKAFMERFNRLNSIDLRKLYDEKYLKK